MCSRNDLLLTAVLPILLLWSLQCPYSLSIKAYDHFADLDSNHDDEFDHEAITGSKMDADDFKQMEPETAKENLQILLKKMDVNTDGYIDRKELQDWIITSFQKLDQEEARMQLQEHDTDGDGIVTWKEYLLKNYGYSEKELQEISDENSPDMQSFIKMIQDDHEKFDVADRDNDGNLTLNEYVAFVRPHNYLFMAPVEVKRHLETFDKNKDGLLNIDEFIGDNVLDNDTIMAEKQHFKHYDVNDDNFLNEIELQPWLVPGFEATALQEVEHLFRETDSDRSEKLSFKKILDSHDLWVGSHATDYGKQLEDLQKDEL